MGRKPREKSPTNTYHIVIRGADRQVMFENERDYQKYLELLKWYKEECCFQIYAYCLMSNHVHLLIHTSEESLESIFRKLNTNYATWFNMKYQRTGSLQQGRYYSEPIADEGYLRNVLRYIHKNPIKAGLEKQVGKNYKWNSYMDYINEKRELINIDFILNLLGGIENYHQFHEINQEDDKKILDIENVIKRIPDDVAKQIIHDECNCDTVMDFQNLKLEERNRNLQKLFDKGLSVRQINRLTGIPRGVIMRKVNQRERP